MAQGEKGVRHLTREQFQSAARRYADVHAGPSAAQLGVTAYARGWEWHEGSNEPFTCHLKRTTPFLLRERREGQEEEEEVAVTRMAIEEETDDGVAIAQGKGGARLATLEQSIVYSSTWRVPVLYMEAFGPDGHLLDMDDLVRSGIVEEMADDKPEESSSAAAEFPRLGMGENPATGRYGVYLHPCQTAAAVGLLLDESQDGLAYLEAFIMLCGTVVKMR